MNCTLIKKELRRIIGDNIKYELCRFDRESYRTANCR